MSEFDQAMRRNNKRGFWRWLTRGSGIAEVGIPGIKNILNRWMWFHLFVGFFLSAFLGDDIESIGRGTMLPLMGVLIGLCFAWAGNAIALLQSKELFVVIQNRGKGFEDYIYGYQLAILTLLITIGCWGLVAFGILNSPRGLALNPTAYFYITILAKAFLFLISSISIRECWGVVRLAQASLLAQFTIKATTAGKRSQSQDSRSTPNEKEGSN